MVISLELISRNGTDVIIFSEVEVSFLEGGRKLLRHRKLREQKTPLLVGYSPKQPLGERSHLW